MTSSANRNKAHVNLRVSLDEADTVIEEYLKAQKLKQPKAQELKHKSFEQVFDIIISVKNYLDSEITVSEEGVSTFNTRPLSRLLEDFRNAYEGAELVLVGHSKPNFVKGGKPQLASANEMNALLVAAVELWRASGLEPKECLAKVSKDAGISEKQLRNIRTRFGRGDGVAKKYKELAFRLARPETHEEIYRYYLSLLDRYQSLK